LQFQPAKSKDGAKYFLELSIFGAQNSSYGNLTKVTAALLQRCTRVTSTSTWSYEVQPKYWL